MGLKEAVLVGVLMVFLLQTTSQVAARDLAGSKLNTDAAAKEYLNDGHGRSLSGGYETPEIPTYGMDPAPCIPYPHC